MNSRDDEASEYAESKHRATVSSDGYVKEWQKCPDLLHWTRSAKHK